MEAIDAEILLNSIQAVRNGMGEGHMREGIVMRPLEEVVLNSGKRVIAKHKRDEFRETATPRKVISEDRLKVIADAKAIATEWVTRERLIHVINILDSEATNCGDGLESHVRIENTGEVIKRMTEDILREAEGEIMDSPDARKEIGRCTAIMFKEYIRESCNS